MFVGGQLLFAVAKLVEYVLWAYMWIIIIRALVSWVNADPWNPIVRFLHQVTEPVLRPIRRMLPASSIDFSPVIAILGIYFLQMFLVVVLLRAAGRLGGYVVY
jgi:YggT family protein